MKNEKKRGKGMFIFICILAFIVSLGIGAISKVAIKPEWSKKYSVKWSEDLGTKITDIAYGEGEANKFDLYLPKDNSKENYGLVIYLHAGGFTQGDKADDEGMLSWLTSKGYVAAGINYTLRTDDNDKSVLSQSNEIKDAVPKVIEEAYTGAAGLFSVMGNVEITPEMIKNGSYQELLKPISAYAWIDENSVPTVVAYGKYDRVQPYKGSLRLLQALKDNNIDYKFFELPHSGHGLQNDDKIFREYMETVEEYLDKYMPVK